MLIRKLFLFPRYCATSAHQILRACNNDVYFQAVRGAPEAFTDVFTSAGLVIRNVWKQ
jgi:hypothetical protein